MYMMWQGMTPQRQMSCICHHCHKKGHYGTRCQTKLDELEEGSGSENMDTISVPIEHTIDSAFLDAVGDTTNTCWTATVSLNGKDIIFKLDTGPKVTAITEETYQTLNAELSPPLKTLYGPGQVSLPVKGHFQGEFTHKGKQTIQLVCMISTLKRKLTRLTNHSSFEPGC